MSFYSEKIGIMTDKEIKLMGVTVRFKSGPSHGRVFTSNWGNLKTIAANMGYHVSAYRPDNLLTVVGEFTFQGFMDEYIKTKQLLRPGLTMSYKQSAELLQSFLGSYVVRDFSYSFYDAVWFEVAGENITGPTVFDLDGIINVWAIANEETWVPLWM